MQSLVRVAFTGDHYFLYIANFEGAFFRLKPVQGHCVYNKMPQKTLPESNKQFAPARNVAPSHWESDSDLKTKL